MATFGGDPTARFDGPISLSLDEVGNVYVGDRFNHVVRMIDAVTGTISTIAGRLAADDDRPNDPGEQDPRQLNTLANSTCLKSAAWTTTAAGCSCRRL